MLFFSGIVVLLCLFLFDIIKSNGEIVSSKKSRLFYLIILFLVAFFRNNGLYIVIALTFLLLFAPRKSKLILLKINTAAIILILTIQGPIFNLLNIQKSSFVESVGIPIQQIADVISKDGNITDDQKSYIDTIMPTEEWGKLYNKHTVDPIKFNKNFNGDVISSNKLVFIQNWLAIGVQNISVYLDAWVSETSGYWQPGVYNYLANSTIEDNTLSIKQSNLMSKVFGFSVYKPASFIYYKVSSAPILRLFFNISFSVYLILAYVVLATIKKKPSYILPITPLVILWVTLLIAAPTFCEFRYMYAFHLMLPVIVVWIIKTLNKKVL